MSIGRPPAVNILLEGGLGNQLFQYAAGTAISDLTGHPLKVVNARSAHPLLEKILDQRLVESDDSHHNNTMRVRAFRRGVRAFHYARQSTNRADLRIYQDAHNTFSVSPGTIDLAAFRHIHLQGYFQHPSWHVASANGVAARLSQFLKAQPDYALGRDAITISFRRGDYVRHGWDIGLQYYTKALEEIHGQGRRVFVLGDDQMFNAFAVSWMRAARIDAAVPPQTSRSAEVRDACVLASSACVVMSNSTFCWWAVAAGLIDQPGIQRVIAPSQWMPFVDGNPLLPPNSYQIAPTFGPDLGEEYSDLSNGAPISLESSSVGGSTR